MNEKTRQCIMKWREKNRESYNAYQREYSRKYLPALRLKVLAHYGNGELACVKCGFNNEAALSIDHINNDGASHRRLIRHYSIYRWLIKNNYPPGHQTLCMNCQWIKKREAIDKG